MIVEALITKIAEAGNIAIVVLTFVNIAMLRMIDKVNELRTQEQTAYRSSVEKMTEALEKVTDALSELRITIASKHQ